MQSSSTDLSTNLIIGKLDAATFFLNVDSLKVKV